MKRIIMLCLVLMLAVSPSYAAWDSDKPAQTQTVSAGMTSIQGNFAAIEDGSASILANSLSDDDADTLIQTEQSSDEDILRFDTGGEERATLDGNGLKLLMGQPAVGSRQSNTLVTRNIIKGWVTFNGSGGAEIQDSFNVISVVRNSVGDYTITWDVDFATTAYCLSGHSMLSVVGSVPLTFTITALTTGTSRFKLRNYAGTPLDGSTTHIIAIGNQLN